MSQIPGPAKATAVSKTACCLVIGGQVQGVGFRPFVYRLALEHGLSGEVRNLCGQVEIRLEGTPVQLAAFEQQLFEHPPAIARPHLIERRPLPPTGRSGFHIVASAQAGPQDIHLPADFHTCDDCLRELNDPADRRYRYPFINCTQCGPRYTLIARLPYDRPNTSMAGFALCRECAAEYEDPASRRFHAEPIACPVCGPQLAFVQGTQRIESSHPALATCISALRAGQIVAVKGVGGYHLLCDAASDAAVGRLRARKPRPDKPLAVLFPQRGGDGLDAVRTCCAVPAETIDLLTSPARPIVLCAAHSDCGLSSQIAPGLAEVGVMLPYSPLHHLLTQAFGGPLVATSANLSGEPVLIEALEVEDRLGRVAEAFLHHDRPILRPADDSLFRPIAGACRPLRLGRGVAPLELSLPAPLSRPLLAVGGHMKNAIALAWADRLVVSPHIGDLQPPRSRDVFERVIDDLQALYGVIAETVVCDAHPGYASHRWAQRSGLPVVPVFHHHAHAAQLAAEHPGIGNWLVFTWDGVGFGSDGQLWGGEALLGRPGEWRRFASLRPFRPPGGEQAARAPWRSAVALCWEAGIDWPAAPPDIQLLQQTWRQQINSPPTSAAGRLFDAAAALAGVLREATFEGQGPMLLESAAADHRGAPTEMPLTQDEHGVWRGDWAPLLPLLMDERRSAAERAANFHASLAHLLLAQARLARAHYGDVTVGLSGGVFQNRRLTESVVSLLAEAGFEVHMPRRLPVNDGGLCVGQVMEAAAVMS